MADQVQQTVRAGRAYEVRVRRLIERAEEKEQAFDAHSPFPKGEPQSGIPRVRPFHAGTFLARQGRTFGDSVNIFRALDLETGLNPSANALSDITRREIRVTDTDNPASYLYSNRPLAAQCAPIPATSELDGHALGVDLRAAPTEAHPAARLIHKELFEAAPWVRRMRTREQQLAALARIESAVSAMSRARYREAVERADSLAREQFDAPTSIRATRDAVAYIPAGPGLWQMGVTCPTNFYGFAPWDERYKVTGREFYSAEEINWNFPVGELQGPEVLLFLAPQRHLTIFQWWALFTLAGFLVPAIQVHIVNTKIFADQLPYWPYPYAYAPTDDQPANDTAMSLFIQQKRTYAAALLEDLAIQFFSWLIALVFERRVEGRWTILRGREYEGDLRAVLEYRTAAGNKKRAYVWNRRTSPLVRELIGYGALTLEPEVYPYIRGFRQYNFSPPSVGPIA